MTEEKNKVWVNGASYTQEELETLLRSLIRVTKIARLLVRNLPKDTVATKMLLKDITEALVKVKN